MGDPSYWHQIFAIQHCSNLFWKIISFLFRIFFPVWSKRVAFVCHFELITSELRQAKVLLYCPQLFPVGKFCETRQLPERVHHRMLTNVRLEEVTPTWWLKSPGWLSHVKHVKIVSAEFPRKKSWLFLCLTDLFVFGLLQNLLLATYHGFLSSWKTYFLSNALK